MMQRMLAVGIVIAACAIFAYHYISNFAFLGSYHAFLNNHLMLALVLVYLLELKEQKSKWGIALISTLLLGSIVAGVYTLLKLDHLESLGGGIDYQDAYFGALYVVVVLEAARRTWGPILPALAIIFIVYFFFGHQLPGALRHGEFFALDVIANLSLGFSSGASGLMNAALNAGASFVVYFTIFGGVLKALGLDRLFNEVGRLAGRLFSGGPGQTAVVASSLLGTVTSGAVANVAMTGVLTIPMMKRAGYRPDVAAAIEASASTGANIVPPVLGTAAFLMVALTGIPYVEVIKAATIPAVLYYLPLFLAVHFWGRRFNIQKIAEGGVAAHFVAVMSLIFVAVIGLILFTLVLRYSPGRVGILATAAAVLLVCLFSMFSKYLHRLTNPHRPRGLLQAATSGILVILIAGCIASLLVNGLAPGASQVPVVSATIVAALVIGTIATVRLSAGNPGKASMATATAARWFSVPMPRPRDLLEGIVDGVTIGMKISIALACVGLVSQTAISTGISISFLRIMEALAGDSFIIPLITTMVATVILGMGMPPVAAYGLVAVIVGPGLVQLGHPTLNVHMFMFFFGVLAAVSPPIALGSLTAASIAGASYIRTCIVALGMSLPGFVIPFTFVTNSALLTWDFESSSWLTLGLAVVILLLLTIGIHGFFRQAFRLWERVLLCASASGMLIHVVDSSPALLGASTALLALYLLWRLAWFAPRARTKAV